MWRNGTRSDTIALKDYSVLIVVFRKLRYWILSISDSNWNLKRPTSKFWTGVWHLQKEQNQKMDKIGGNISFNFVSFETDIFARFQYCRYLVMSW